MHKAYRVTITYLYQNNLEILWVKWQKYSEKPSDSVRRPFWDNTV